MTRHILISLCGTSPAVVTETVFMLAKAGDPPDKVVVITTVTGGALSQKGAHRFRDLGVIEEKLATRDFLFTQS